MRVPSERPLPVWKTVLFAALACLAASVLSSAQCPIPDGLDGGPCCALTAEKLPPFKAIGQSALDICWRDCGIEAVNNCRALWTPLHIYPSTGPDCSFQLARLDLFDTVGNLKWRGVMGLHYARTWIETDPSGTPLQVWRFLVNGDLRSTPAAGTPPCPLPACAPVFGNKVRFTGYIDYAQSCVAVGPGIQIAWMLTHACDPIDHAPGHPRAGSFHPGRSFTFVGPAAGFVVNPVVATEGTAGSVFEDVRRMRPPPPGTVGPIQCEFEERVNFSLTPNSVFCMCATGAPLSAQWNTAPLNVNGACGTTITPPGTIVPGFLSMGIGRWTIAANYPGLEDLRWNVGSYTDNDPCTGIARNAIAYGVTTLGGYPAQALLSSGVGAALPLVFIDQCTSIRPATGAPVANVPFRSDLVLNLNQ